MVADHSARCAALAIRVGNIWHRRVERMAGVAFPLCGICNRKPVLCVSIGVLTARLALHGRAAPIGTSQIWWIGTFLGIGLTAIGLFEVVSAKLGMDELLDARLRLFAAGMPLLLPAAHVLLERARANKAMAPTR